MGVVLFGAEQFRSAIPPVTGNCATHAYGRTNIIEVSSMTTEAFPALIRVY